jgi:O-antigen/teichoic acid export membrane protein
MSGIGVGLSLLTVARHVVLPRHKLDTALMRRLIAESVPFMVIAIAQNCVTYLDRYVIKILLGVEHVGAYAFFGNLALGLSTIAYAAATITFYPKLVRFSASSNKPAYVDTLGEYLRVAALYVAIGAVALLVLAPSVLSLVGKGYLNSQVTVLYLLVVAQTINAIFTVFHHGLYALHHDTHLRAVYVAAAIVNLLSTTVLVSQFGIVGAAGAALLTSAVLGVALLSNHARALREWNVR